MLNTYSHLQKSLIQLFKFFLLIFEGLKMDKEISKIIEDLNQEFKTDLTDDVKPLLRITLKNIKEGMAFEDAFKSAFESILKSTHRLSSGTKRREIAKEVLWGKLYEKVFVGEI